MKFLFLAIASVFAFAATTFMAPQAEAQGGVTIRPGRPGYYRPYPGDRWGRPGWGRPGWHRPGRHDHGWGRPGWGHHRPGRPWGRH